MVILAFILRFVVFFFVVGQDSIAVSKYFDFLHSYRKLAVFTLTHY